MTKQSKNATETTEAKGPVAQETESKSPVKFVGEEALNTEIESVIKDSASVTERIANVSFQALMFAAKTGNFGPLTRLYSGLHQGQRKDALRQWIVAFAPATWDANKKVFMKDTTESAVAFDLEGALKTPYYDFTKENEQIPMTAEEFVKMLQRQVKKVNDRRSDGETLDEQTVKMSEAVQAIIDSYTSDTEKALADKAAAA